MLPELKTPDRMLHPKLDRRPYPKSLCLPLTSYLPLPTPVKGSRAATATAPIEHTREIAAPSQFW